ncbi:hypothetical protein BH11ACT2_BH11ACT2_04750 [soil metagenome]
MQPIEALAQICVCQSIEFAYVVCESALFMRQVTRGAFDAMVARQSERVVRELRLCTAVSESGTESMFAFRARKLGLSFHQQVWIGPDRVDFVIGQRLVIEIDSIEHHDPTADCIRDCRLSIRGYRVLRFMYSQIVDDWLSVQASVLAAISRGDHLAS